MKSAIIASILLVPVFASTAPAQSVNAASRKATLDAQGIRRVKVSVGSGSLKIEGRSGQTSVVVNGVARGRSVSVVEGIKLVAEREGDEIVVRSVIPEQTWRVWQGDMSSLDLVIEVPAGMPVAVTDGSGDIMVTGVGALQVEDGSGNITLRGISGSVQIRDGSGEIDVAGVDGGVEVSDGSGGITVNTVTGSVSVLSDGSGGIVARGIGSSVAVERDGSGDISVERVGGDFIVDRKGSGEVTHKDVKGRVEIPERRRRRSR